MRVFIRFFQNLKLQSKLLLSYMLVVFIPLSMWGAYTYQQTNYTLLEQTRVSFQDVCTNITENFNSKFQRIENAFSLIANDPSLSQIINAHYINPYSKYYDITYKFDPTLSTFRLLNPEIKKITIYTDGSIQSVRQSFRNMQNAQADHEQLSTINEEGTTWFVEDRRLFAARQVFDLNDLSRSSIILLELDYDGMLSNNISEELQNYGLFIEDTSEAVIYRNDLSDEINAEEPQKAIYQRRDILRHTETLSFTGWSLFLYMDTNSILLPPSIVFQSVLFQLALSALLLALIIPPLSHTMVKRIEVLDTYLSRVVKSGFQEDISTEYHDEVGNITNRIGMMVRDTRTLIDKVYESQLRQREAEIKALQSQINPHFLYNTLSAINWQAIKSNNPEISKIVTALSAFYRSTLNQGQSITTVSQELETTRAFLDIQQTIHENSFDVEYVIDENVLEYNMPGIILQPIAENAIEHGIDLKEDGERGKIRIEVRSEDNDIVFEVCDNGPGIQAETIRDVFTNERKGYGVKNVDERLKLFFDAHYGLSFRQVDRAGTRAVIRIPRYIDLEPLKELS